MGNTDMGVSQVQSPWRGFMLVNLTCSVEKTVKTDLPENRPFKEENSQIVQYWSATPIDPHAVVGSVANIPCK